MKITSAALMSQQRIRLRERTRAGDAHARKSDPRASAQASAQASGPGVGQGGDLAASIRRDGGLAFLQSRLQEKLSATVSGTETEEAQATAAYGGSGPDLSPEAVAGRIVSFALGLRQVYDRQNSDLSAEERQAGFEAQVRRGIGDGFDQARGILGDLNLLDEDVQATTDRTWELVQQKLDEHFSPGEEAESTLEAEAEPELVTS